MFNWSQLKILSKMLPCSILGYKISNKTQQDVNYNAMKYSFKIALDKTLRVQCFLRYLYMNTSKFKLLSVNFVILGCQAIEYHF